MGMVDADGLGWVVLVDGARWRVVSYQGATDDLRAAGVRLKNPQDHGITSRGPLASLAPEWAVALWAWAPIVWSRVVLMVAQRDPETREALLALLELAGVFGAQQAIRAWCEARWDGPTAALLDLGGYGPIAF